METLATDFAPRAHFLFIYTREAHPGQTFNGHTSLEQKVRHAQALRERGVKGPILVDTLDGQVHRLYGGLSNMSWMVDHTGRVAFRASWTVADDIRAVLKETLRVQEQRRQGTLNAVYYREIVGLKAADPPGSRIWAGGDGAAEEARRSRAATAEHSPYWDRD